MSEDARQRPDDGCYAGTLIEDLVTLVDINRWNQKPERRTTLSTKETSSTSQITTIKPRARGERGSGTTITIDLSEYPILLTAIRNAAKLDDREPSKFVRRILIRHLGEEGESIPKCLLISPDGHKELA